MKALWVIATLFLLSCSANPPNSAERNLLANSSQPPLVVGVATHYPPIIFQKDDVVTGLDADFAEQLALDLNRPLQFKVMPWHDLIPSLQQNQIDIIMSGMSITAKREKQVLFSLPYMTIGQMAIVRKQNAAELNPPGALHSGEYVVGYVKETTGEDFVLNQLTGERVGFIDEMAAKRALIKGDIDYFIHDAPTAWQLANSPDPIESELLMGLYVPLTVEELAWAVNRNNFKLLDEVNSAFLKWRANGFLHQTVQKWIPATVSVVPQ